MSVGEKLGVCVFEEDPCYPSYLSAELCLVLIICIECSLKSVVHPLLEQYFSKCTLGEIPVLNDIIQLMQNFQLFFFLI